MELDVSIKEGDYTGAAYVALKLRPFDRYEISTFLRDDPDYVVKRSCVMADKFWVVYRGEEPLAVAGYVVQSWLTSDAIPFFFLTDKGEKNRHRFARLSPVIVEKMSEFNLNNFTLASNSTVLNWLKWLGFELGREAEVRGEKVIYFRKEKANV